MARLQHKSTKNANGRLNEITINVSDNCRLSALSGSPKRKTGNKLKAVILVHGFAAEKTENGLFSRTAKLLLSQGYYVVSYDWRGLGKSEGDFSTSCINQHANDFRDVADWVERERGITTTEICAVGFSLGAAVVAKTIKSGHKMGRAALWSPAVRPSISMWPRYNTDEIREELNTTGFITKPGSKVKLRKPILESLRDTDLGEDAFDLDVPLLVCHGSADVRIPVEDTRQSFRDIEKKVRGVSYTEFEGASHSFRPAEDHRQKLIELLLEWLKDDKVKNANPIKNSFQPKTTPIPH